MVVPLSNAIYAQGCMEVHRGVWRHAEVTDGCTEGLVKVYKGTQGAQRYAGCTGGIQRWVKVDSGVLKCMEECIGL